MKLRREKPSVILNVVKDPRHRSLYHARPCGFFPMLRMTVAIVGFLLALGLPASELDVKGLGWFGNRAAEQRLKLLLGEQRGGFLDANGIEDAALVLISSINENGYLEPKVIARVTLGNGKTEDYPLDAKLEHSLPRP